MSEGEEYQSEYNDSKESDVRQSEAKINNEQNGGPRIIINKPDISLSQRIQMMDASPTIEQGEINIIIPRVQEIIERKKSVKYSYCQLQCPICFENVPDDEIVSFTKCTHTFCIKCSIKYIKQEIENFNRVQCPTKGCGAFLNKKSVILTFLTADELEKLTSIQNKFQIKQQLQEEGGDQIEIQIQKSMNYETPEKQKSNISRLQSKKSGEKIQKKTNSPDINNFQIKNNSNLNPNIGLSSLTGSQSFDTNHVIEIQQKEMKKSRVIEGERDRKQPNRQEYFPVKCFDLLCSQIWSNKWKNFFKILPISIILVLLLIIMLVTWALWVALYFMLVWTLFVPTVWSVYEIWGCFQRSIKNKCANKVVFCLCLFGFPLLFLFFYFLTLILIIYDSIHRPDMQRILKGKCSIILSCRKINVNLNKKPKKQCQCRRKEKCQRCGDRKAVFCFLF